jgi:catechol 2,3-dioxygenase-like lactoylglutathione lyase family enzyme
MTTSTRVHINLPVADLDASIAFYSRVFGISPSKLRSDYANFRLDEPALHLALVHKPGLSTKEALNGQVSTSGLNCLMTVSSTPGKTGLRLKACYRIWKKRALPVATRWRISSG